MSQPDILKPTPRLEQDEAARARAGSWSGLGPSEWLPPASEPPSSGASELELLRRQLAAPRTPLMLAPGLLDAPVPAQARSMVDTLSPSESVPPPAPFLADPPPHCPAVVPPVRLPRSDPPRMWLPRPPSVPPPPLAEERFARPSSIPPPSVAATSSRRSPDGSGDGREAPEAAAIPSPFAETQPQDLRPEALRREVPTVPIDANVLAQRLSGDPSLPLPLVRRSGFDPETLLPRSTRQQENRRIGGVAVVLLVSLLVVAGAVTGINYAAKGRQESDGNPTRAAASTGPRIIVERVRASALVGPKEAATNPHAPTPVRAQPAPTRAAANSGSQPALNSKPAPAATQSEPSPWQKDEKARVANPSGSRVSKGLTKPKPRIDPRSIDTETPLIMD